MLVQGYTQDCKLTYRQFLDACPAENISGGMGRGNRGDEVTALQKRLVGLGFCSEAPTGIYDEATTLAVMRYQAVAGETVNGVVSRDLLESIMDDDGVTAEYSTLTPGCEGPIVERLKLALAAAGFYQCVIDGIYDDGLADAVADYCASKGRQAVQSVDPALRAEIYELARSGIQVS